VRDSISRRVRKSNCAVAAATAAVLVPKAINQAEKEKESRESLVRN